MLDYLAILKKLDEKSIRYIVVGGIAVNLYGIPRMTYDIDLLLDLDDKNLKKFLNLLKNWGFKPKVPVDIMDFAKKDKREDWIKNKNMKAFNLVNPAWAISEIDIVIDSPVDYDKAYKSINKVKLHGVTIPVVSIDDLIKMKEKTKRKQDMADIRYLKEVKSEKK
ncbi:MAG: nucleotidyl transferase AbiEii/AbiGii toxin family protein [Deltaproteobacteria bacterium]|nr:nucleotidyl transferase AbiEii/AbiGii toxin family protein [Deltaproteobacteria bacterium]